MRRTRRNRELMGDGSCRDMSPARALASATNWFVVGVILSVGVAAMLFATGLAWAWAPWFVLGAIVASMFTAVANPLEFRDPVVSGMVIRLTRARQARAKAIADSPFGRHHALATSQHAVADVERRALVAIARAEYARSFLADSPEGVSSDGDVSRLRGAEQSAPCAGAVQAYRQAARWSAERRAAVRRIEARSAVLIARLEHLLAILESLPTKLVEAELLRIEDADRIIGADIAAAEDELAGLGAPAGLPLEPRPSDEPTDIKMAAFPG